MRTFQTTAIFRENIRCFHEKILEDVRKNFGCNPSCVVEMVWWDGWWMSNHCGSCPNRRGGSTPPPPLKPLICVSSQPAIQNHLLPPTSDPSLDQPYWPSAEDGFRASMQNMGHWFWILVCAVNFVKFVLPILRIRIRLFSSRIPDPGLTRSRIPDSESGSASKNTK